MAPSQRPATFKPALIIHGGAGNIQRARLPPELWARYRASLHSYLRSTYELLNGGGGGGDDGDGDAGDEVANGALAAVTHAVACLEDDELFNCGRGSVFTTAGTVEMEASVMVASVRSGADGDANEAAAATDEERRWRVKRGAGVIGLRNVKNPIKLAREALLRNGYDGADGGNMHSQLAGEAAEALARHAGLEFRPDEYFWTRKRWDEHRRGLAEKKAGGGGGGGVASTNVAADAASADDTNGINQYLSQGTVGAVALDRWGNIAVATSTGGMTNKLPGRIGDTPCFGAGFWAESFDEACTGPSATHRRRRRRRRAMALSATGNGDSCLRVSAARTVLAQARFGGAFLADALTAMTGPGGELQRSAGDRWGVTGEGQCGMIGIEAEVESEAEAEGEGEEEALSDDRAAGGAAAGSLRKGTVVWDLNCGGMFRAWIEEGPDGQDVERVMAFRGEYEEEAVVGDVVQRSRSQAVDQ
ncbi:hypothetical protein KEM52_002821 [Ascosphaera acerosa]|nr:hypothetical protein KEM52_002821 [Ascosphaera acerosa]